MHSCAFCRMPQGQFVKFFILCQAAGSAKSLVSGVSGALPFASANMYQGDEEE